MTIAAKIFARYIPNSRFGGLFLFLISSHLTLLFFTLLSVVNVLSLSLEIYLMLQTVGQVVAGSFLVAVAAACVWLSKTSHLEPNEKSGGPWQWILFGSALGVIVVQLAVVICFPVTLGNREQLAMLFFYVGLGYLAWTLACILFLFISRNLLETHLLIIDSSKRSNASAKNAPAPHRLVNTSQYVPGRYSWRLSYHVPAVIALFAVLACGVLLNKSITGKVPDNLKMQLCSYLRTLTFAYAATMTACVVAYESLAHIVKRMRRAQLTYTENGKNWWSIGTLLQVTLVSACVCAPLWVAFAIVAPKTPPAPDPRFVFLFVALGKLAALIWLLAQTRNFLPDFLAVRDELIATRMRLAGRDGRKLIDLTITSTSNFQTVRTAQELLEESVVNKAKNQPTK